MQKPASEKGQRFNDSVHFLCLLRCRPRRNAWVKCIEKARREQQMRIQVRRNREIGKNSLCACGCVCVWAPKW